jgi:hypothetical protein
LTWNVNGVLEDEAAAVAAVPKISEGDAMEGAVDAGAEYRSDKDEDAPEAVEC